MELPRSVTVTRGDLVNLYAGVSVKAGPQDTCVVGLRLKGVNALGPGVDHPLRDGAVLGSDVEHRTMLETAQQDAQQRNLRLLAVCVHSR